MSGFISKTHRDHDPIGVTLLQQTNSAYNENCVEAKFFDFGKGTLIIVSIPAIDWHCWFQIKKSSIHCRKIPTTRRLGAFSEVIYGTKIKSLMAPVDAHLHEVDGNLVSEARNQANLSAIDICFSLNPGCGAPDHTISATTK